MFPLAVLCGTDVQIVPMGVDDMWLRDSGPVFLTAGQARVHIDGIARFAKPAVVLVDQGLPEAARFLRESSDARNRPLKVIEVPRPGLRKRNRNFCDCYLNFYTPNGALIMPSFGQARSDDRARGLVAGAFPERQILPIRLDAIAAGGGLMHCVTQPEPGA